MAFLRKYGVITATGTHIRIPMLKAGSRDAAQSADWTPATNDVKISKDSAAVGNIAALPTFVGGMWEFHFTAAELQCQTLTVQIIDAATKAVDDNAFEIETYGDPAALHQFDLSSSLAAQVIAAIGDKGDGLYDPATDSLQAIRDRGDAVWVAALPIASGTAQGGASTTITLDATNSALLNFYKWCGIQIIGGTGIGQERVILSGTTGRVNTVDEAWVTPPDNTSQYVIGPARSAAVAGTIQAVSGAVGSVTGAVGSVTGAVGSVTGNVGGNVNGNVTGSVGSVVGNVGGSVASLTTNNDKTGYTLSNTGMDNILTRALTEAYSTRGSTITLAQFVYEVMAILMEAVKTGTSVSFKGRDHTTEKMTATLDDATNPQTITRTT